jgi:eukaryotic-like serine/threonine-protein kinase
MNKTPVCSSRELENAMNAMNAVDAEPVADEVAAWMFFRTLKASGLLPPVQIEALERGAAAMPFAEFQRLLVQDGHLTDYQLKRILDGNGRGLVIGQYRILAELGRGGCGQVYKARHALMDRIVAIKVIGQDLANSAFARDMFVREVVASTRLNHPNIAAAYHADEFEGQVFFVLEYVDGPTLQDMIEAAGPVSVPLACKLLLETAQALQHAHELGIVHRDIKPANIMLPGMTAAPGGPAAATVKIVDFGLARIGAGDGTNRTIPCREGALVGTPAFMAPEQIDDVHSVDIRSDLYSLGCTIYHALVGRQPFKGCSTDATLYLHLHEEAMPVRDLRPHTPARLAGIVHRLMEKDPAKRFQSPAELFEAVNDFVLSGDLCDGDACQRIMATATTEDRSAVDVLHPGCGVLSRGPAPIVDLRVAPAEPNAEPAVEPSVESVDAALDRLWFEWFSLVQRLAEGRSANITPRNYRALYRDLVLLIRKCPPTDSVGCRIESLVEPWVSLESLLNLEFRMLESLAENARVLDGEIGSEGASGSDGWIGRWVMRVFS